LQQGDTLGPQGHFLHQLFAEGGDQADELRVGFDRGCGNFLVQFPQSTVKRKLVVVEQDFFHLAALDFTLFGFGRKTGDEKIRHVGKDVQRNQR